MKGKDCRLLLMLALLLCQCDKEEPLHRHCRLAQLAAPTIVDTLYQGGAHSTIQPLTHTYNAFNQTYTLFLRIQWASLTQESHYWAEGDLMFETKLDIMIWHERSLSRNLTAALSAPGSNRVLKIDFEGNTSL